MLIKRTFLYLWSSVMLSPNVRNPNLNTNSNRTSFFGYVYNAVIKFEIYFTSHMRIIWGQIMDIIRK